jgi:uncharacterized membrane protein YccC
MAIQMAVALTAAFAAGRYLYPQHWSWLVLTAYIVGSGNRGRGDVAYKSALRVLGAAAGTVAATAVAGLYPPGDRTPIVIIFVVLAVASWLRSINYAYWAAGITAALALLYGYFGQTGTTLLRERLAAIAVGAVIGLAAAWFVLPVRTTDVARRRIADLLAVLTDYLSTARRCPRELAGQQRRLETALDQLAQVAAPLRAHGRLTRGIRGDRHHLDDAVRALLACRPTTRRLTRYLVEASSAPDQHAGQELELLRQRVISTRRAMARHRTGAPTAGGDAAQQPTRPWPDTGVPPLDQLDPLAQLDQALGITLTAVAVR